MSKRENLANMIEYFRNRVLISNNSYHQIIDINTDKQAFSTIRLFDPNGVQINTEFYVKSGYLSYIPVDSVSTSTKLVSKEESRIILEKFKSSAPLTLAVFNNNGVPEIVSSIPEVNLEDYTPIIVNGRIDSLKNKEIGFEVQFLAEQLSASQIQNFPRYQDKKLKFKVYWSLIGSLTFNVFHVHHNLPSNDVSFESVVENDIDDKTEESAFDFTLKFSKTTKKLDKVVKMATKSAISFEQVSVKSGDIVKIEKGDFIGSFAKIVKVPTGVLPLGLDGDVTTFGRMSTIDFSLGEDTCSVSRVEGLNGNLRLNLLFNTHLEWIEGELIESVCNLSKVEGTLLVRIETMMKQRKKSGVDDELLNLIESIFEYEKWGKEEIEQLSKEKSLEMLDKLNKTEEIEEFSKKVGETEKDKLVRATEIIEK